MRILYIDAFSGVAGDMLLGALVDAGVPLDTIRAGLASLPLEGWSLSSRTVDRAGQRATKVEVELAADTDKHGRHLSNIEAVLDRGSLSPRVLETARLVFRRLVEAEARVHGSTPERVHLHEAGAVDALVDVVGTLLGIEALGAEQIVCSPLPLGGGSVEAAHGRLPVPAPAVAELLRGVPVRGGPVEVELVTPTGAALVKTLAEERFGSLPAMQLERVGIGAGTRDFEGRPNVLRLFVGRTDEARSADSVVVLETNLDDTSPEVLSYTLERLLEAGALDATLTPLTMKKGRPGHLLRVLSPHGKVEELEEIVFAETPTLGIRRQTVMRTTLVRRSVEVATPWGTVRVKVAAGRAESPKPEFEDCRSLARETGLPLSRIQAAAIEAFERGRTEE